LVERTQLEERLRQQPVTNHELEAGIEECLPLQNAEWVRQAS